MKERNSRDEWLMEMRPTLDLDTTDAGEMERFQNITLRPILKFQNTALLLVLKNYLIERKKPFKAFNQSVQKRMISDYVQNDHTFRRELVQFIVANFTESELKFYFKNRSESSKRIVQMMIERFNNQLERLV